MASILTKKLTVRVSEQEAKFLQDAAAAHGVGLSEYMRQLIVSAGGTKQTNFLPAEATMFRTFYTELLASRQLILELLNNPQQPLSTDQQKRQSERIEAIYERAKDTSKSKMAELGLL